MIQNKLKIPKKPRSLLLTLGVAGLVILGGSIAYFLIRRGAVGAIPVGAEILPQESLLSVSVSTSPNQWSKFQDLGTAETQQALQQRFNDLRTRYLTDNGLNYPQDIQPWIGDEATVAILPATGQSASSGQQSMVWVLPIENLNRARQTLSQRSQTGQPTRTYKGLEIQELQGQSSQVSATVLDNRLFVLASTPSAMNQVVDTYRGGASLVKTPGFKAALGEIKASQPFARIYVNLPTSALQAIADSGRQTSAEAKARIQDTQGLGSTILLEANSIRLKSISWLKPNSERKLQAKNNPGDLLNRLPENTVMMASGGSFQQIWQEYAQGTESQAVVPFNPNQFQARVQTATGMNFNQDFVEWMDGEFALALLPTSAQTSQGVGLVLIAQTSDRKAADRSLAQLDSVMRSRFNLNVSESKVGNQPLTTWKVPPGLPVASHGWLEDDVAFLSLGAPVERAILPQPKTDLASTELFQTSTRSDLNRPSGYFFIDMARTQALLDSSPLLPKLAPSLRKFTTATHAIGVTTAIDGARTTRYDVLVELKN